ncbi:hypothetical protein [Elioraea sp.]|uniref:hypothetical protein n=1 Tax=Elioraea sp. TaxID=2185103 RepID=UPI003F700FD2
MANRLYAIAFNWIAKDFDFMSFAQYIQDSRDFPAWWNRLPFFFLVSSPLNAAEIANKLRIFARDSHFLVIEVLPEHCDGWLPGDAWDWINQQIQPQPPGGLTALLPDPGNPPKG